MNIYDEVTPTASFVTKASIKSKIQKNLHEGIQQHYAFIAKYITIPMNVLNSERA